MLSPSALSPPSDDTIAYARSSPMPPVRATCPDKTAPAPTTWFSARVKSLTVPGAGMRHRSRRPASDQRLVVVPRIHSGGEPAGGKREGEQRSRLPMGNESPRPLVA